MPPASAGSPRDGSPSHRTSGASASARRAALVLGHGMADGERPSAGAAGRWRHPPGRGCGRRRTRGVDNRSAASPLLRGRPRVSARARRPSRPASRRPRGRSARPRAAPRAPRPRPRSPRSAASTSRSTIDGSARTAWKRSSSRSFCQPAITIVATLLPIAFVSARPSLMMRSMPTTSAMPTAIASAEKNSPPKACSDAVSVTRPAPVMPGGALAREDHQARERDLLADRHVLARGLHDEQRAEREVDAGAVEVERVARRDHDADGLPRRARRLELRQQARQHGLRRRGADDDQQLVLDEPDRA